MLCPDEAVAEEYGRVKGELASQGTPIPDNDIWVAAAAIQRGLPLVARDRHFDHIARLTVLDW